jgi:hypothetical protein
MAHPHKLDVSTALQVKIYPQYPHRIAISWDIGRQVPFPLAFNIYRSGGDKGEFTKLNVAPIVGNSYLDEGLQPISKIFNVLYQLEIIYPFQEETQLLNPQPLVCTPSLKRSYLVAKRMDQKYFIEYRARSGQQFVILKQRDFGEQCTECYNPVTEAATKSNCGGCFGTTIEGGFWNPIETIGKIDPETKVQRLGAMQFEEPINTQASLRAFPIVKKGDILVEKCNNNRWYINTVQVVEHGRYPVKQLAEIRLIERTSIIYEIDVE